MDVLRQNLTGSSWSTLIKQGKLRKPQKIKTVHNSAQTAKVSEFGDEKRLNIDEVHFTAVKRSSNKSDRLTVM